jgi:hypothetical protein
MGALHQPTIYLRTRENLPEFSFQFCIHMCLRPSRTTADLGHGPKATLCVALSDVLVRPQSTTSPLRICNTLRYISRLRLTQSSEQFSGLRAAYSVGCVALGTRAHLTSQPLRVPQPRVEQIGPLTFSAFVCTRHPT